MEVLFAIDLNEHKLPKKNLQLEIVDHWLTLLDRLHGFLLDQLLLQLLWQKELSNPYEHMQQEAKPEGNENDEAKHFKFSRSLTI